MVFPSRDPSPTAAALEDARSLMDMGRHAEADARLLETVRQFPDHAGLAAASARAAMALGQWATAEGRWRALTLAQPDRLEGWIGLAEALILQGAAA
jgi:predicted Zn-dependent protease